MAGRDPVEVTNLDRYGNPPLLWSRVDEALAAATPSPSVTCFLGTVRPDGRPSAAGVGAVWLNGDLYFTSSPKARKARNLAENPACTLSMRLEGVDVVAEGQAAQVTDGPTLEEVAAVYRGAGWPAEVTGEAFTAPFNAPSAGPPPWQLYRMRVGTVFGVATVEPYGATRWRFEAGAERRA
ncbi:pyridoxamine 5'-phosphate oxidase family protein [Streptacidiphilus jiangxiensis]|uniref:Nitroimidazol reductase NimA, pyridoxamine 5'-phosphate oxidase superfamily n=1 Tax=Streptacidiphilus jiangxiensis TaxID=235985 RepID=A0A1H7UKY8_STRJI|nr:pyridoxamine 5'-phosphate oxidase family protein [Streptacidiphilus jiangxiensis]SEL97414.1 Nitroimidazol reductase NimA, pyridoxamine 5'-phosphate oxidase superfamily [Streptacidiphilus jiangxiensis]